MAMTKRPPAYAQLVVDSLDRYGAGFPTAGQAITTSSDWQTQLQQIVLNGYFTRLAVTQIQFQWNLPTIITGYNDRFTIFGGSPAIDATIVIPQGYYTPAVLAALLQALLQAAIPSGGFTVTFTAANGAFQITSTSNFVVGGLPLGGGANVFTRTALTLGFFNTAPPATTFIGTPPTMLATRFVDICSSTLTKFQRVKDVTSLPNPTITNIIARVYPVAPNTRINTLADGALTDSSAVGSCPFTICIDYNTPKSIKWSPDEPLSNFDLQLRDENGALLPWNPTSGGPACEYQLTILASES